MQLDLQKPKNITKNHEEYYCCESRVVMISIMNIQKIRWWQHSLFQSQHICVDIYGT